MCTYIISDLHLSENKPEITLKFFNFIKQYIVYADNFYILGDFFDYWIGDDDTSLLHKEVANHLKKLTLNGVHCYFIHGNRDFLIRNLYAKKCGMKILSQETLLNIYNKRILILHGDTLCTNDIKYQNYRKKICNKHLQNIFLKLPLFVRHIIAQKIRKNSKNTKIFKTKNITDVNYDNVINIFKKYQTQWIIHGHTHYPNIHKIYFDNKIHYRGVLSKWGEKSSAFVINKYGIKLFFFKYKNIFINYLVFLHIKIIQF
ncbi:UDP-2,3-diacylglucosamine hydrolase [Candidatus Providencia siddallii]|uniref:UDP-2,3-diacylglucosamine hydrolase n=1 Tax=Candidatus Providencia siddallii TaxID=1715285 RepID=A0A0M6W9B1_9GAMM|nr:UDP-2,3-diacylglucosamine hydrolase [Candidatus Providencia siddallii]